MHIAPLNDGECERQWVSTMAFCVETLQVMTERLLLTKYVMDFSTGWHYRHANRICACWI